MEGFHDPPNDLTGGPPIKSSLLFVTEGLPYALTSEAEQPLPRVGPLDADRWEWWMRSHPDIRFTSAIGQTIRRGVKIGYQGPEQLQLHLPHLSALQAPHILRADIEKQLQHNRLTVLHKQPKQRHISSPLGLVPKSDGGFRRIHDLLYPKGSSVNDHIPHDHGALEYVTFDDAVDAVLQHGKGAIMVKRDLSDAFRHIPIALSDGWLLGFWFEGVFYEEQFLPFGLRTAPFLFDSFSRALNWILMAVLFWYLVIHYLDDFLAILAPDTNVPLYEQQFDALCEQLGLTVNRKKNVTGTTVEFLGLEIDTISLQARLPRDKLVKGESMLSAIQKRTSISRSELEAIIGFLSFASKVVIPGRSFLRRLYDALERPNTYWIHISSDMRKDLTWWESFLSKWNGVWMLRTAIARKPRYLWTDASGTIGIGGYLLRHLSQDPDALHAFGKRIPSRYSIKDIQVKEMMAVQLSISRWLPELIGKALYIFNDNQAVCFGLMKLSIRGDAMHPLRQIALLLASHDIVVMEVKWIHTYENSLADMLSRLQWERIADKYPQLQSLAPNLSAQVTTH